VTQARRRTGQIGEDRVAAGLQAAGWSLIERNARTREGEIDLIARDGETLVFVEVKTLRAGSQRGPERPVMAVGMRKQLRIRRLARAWLAELREPERGRRDELPPERGYRSIRFDVIGIRLDAEDRVVDSEHIRGAF
jgi:putative endonuclease